MFARATSGDQKNNRLFSPCSRSSMDGVMDVKGRCVETKCCFRGNPHHHMNTCILKKAHSCIHVDIRCIHVGRWSSSAQEGSPPRGRKTLISNLTSVALRRSSGEEKAAGVNPECKSGVEPLRQLD